MAMEFCSCGCGASLKGWSNVGQRMGRRKGVERKYTEAHGLCEVCGEMLDQYEVCRSEGAEDHGVGAGRLESVLGLAEGLSGACVTGEPGSGKSTVLRQLARIAVGQGRSVAALQLQADNSVGYAGHGATEFSDLAEFKRHVEKNLPRSRGYLLIVDGIPSANFAVSIQAWFEEIAQGSTAQLICASNGEEVLSHGWPIRRATVHCVSTRDDGRFLAGTIQAAGDEIPRLWEMPIPNEDEQSVGFHQID